jgi:site-specific DNA-methyltransferase (adenine-specific)
MLKTLKNGRRQEFSVPEKFAERDRVRATNPSILETTHEIYLGDSREASELLNGREIHLVVTSPPYWDLKEYAGEAPGDGQLGHINDRDDFMNQVGSVWKACFDALAPGGRLCIVVGDVCRSRKRHGRHLVEPLHAYLLAQCQDMGFDPLAPIIWSKISKLKTEVEGNGSPFLGKPYEPNAVVKNDIEYILMFRKPGGYRKPTSEQRALSLIDPDDHRVWFQQIWDDVPGASQKHHPAPFPTELARRLIGMFSFVGDTVFDPFWGLGTTTNAAMEMHRSSIGVEIEPSYFKKAMKSVNADLYGGQINFFPAAGRS